MAASFMYQSFIRHLSFMYPMHAGMPQASFCVLQVVRQALHRSALMLFSSLHTRMCSIRGALLIETGMRLNCTAKPILMLVQRNGELEGIVAQCSAELK